MATPSRPQRADAVRNRAIILAAAREQITQRGPEIGMDEIARAAGVAVGTLYRHFPTKTDLVGAVIAEYTVAVAVDAEAAQRRVEAGSAPGTEVATFIERVLDASATNHAVKAAAQGLGVPHHGDAEAEIRASSALAAVVYAGQQAGQIRPGITVDDLYLLMTTAPTDQPAAARRRWLDLVLPGVLSSR